jgi:hypothetical protein
MVYLWTGNKVIILVFRSLRSATAENGVNRWDNADFIDQLTENAQVYVHTQVSQSSL